MIEATTQRAGKNQIDVLRVFIDTSQENSKRSMQKAIFSRYA